MLHSKPILKFSMKTGFSAAWFQNDRGRAGFHLGKFVWERRENFKIILIFMSVTNHPALMAGCRSVHIIIIIIIHDILNSNWVNTMMVFTYTGMDNNHYFYCDLGGGGGKFWGGGVAKMYRLVIR